MQPNIVSLQENINHLKKKYNEIEQRKNEIEDEVFKDFCERYNIDNIRNYESKDLK